MNFRAWQLGVALTLTACSGNRDAQPTPTPSALVTLARATTADIAEATTIYGEIERGGATQISLAAPIEAVVLRIEAPAGSAVQAGQVIARLQDSPASRAQSRTAAADAVAAREALARALRLRSDGLASDADVEAARSRAAAASALSGAFEARTASLLLRAPQAGFVDSIGASTGELVPAGSVVAVLSRAGAGWARFGVDPALARRLAAGMPIRVRAGNGTRSFDARIASISPVALAQTRLASLLVHLPADAGVAAGQTVSAQVVADRATAAVAVPYAALLDDAGQPYLFVVTDAIAHRRDVRIGATDGKHVAILSGVHAGEQVVTAGVTGVEDGMRVRTR